MTKHQHHENPVDPDRHLVSEVKNGLLEGLESAGIDVHVAAEDGVVRLHGVVDVLSHKVASEEVARRTAGVKQVVNDITVANEEAVSDKELLRAVTATVTSHKELFNVGCRVHRGVVTLVGHTGSYGDVKKAMRLVEGMAGVRSVRVDRMKVGEGNKDDDADVSRHAERLLDQMGYEHELFQVYSADGTLFVKGFVPRREDRSRIKTAMHTIPGVQKLQALLISSEQMGDEIH